MQTNREGKGEVGNKGKGATATQKGNRQTDVLYFHKAEPNHKRLGELLPYRQYDHIPQR